MFLLGGHFSSASTLKHRVTAPLSCSFNVPHSWGFLGRGQSSRCAMHQGEPLPGNVLTLGKQLFWLKVACSLPSMENPHFLSQKKGRVCGLCLSATLMTSVSLAARYNVGNTPLGSRLPAFFQGLFLDILFPGDPLFTLITHAPSSPNLHALMFQCLSTGLLIRITGKLFKVTFVAWGQAQSLRFLWWQAAPSHEDFA